jgi:hypothetical protein
MILNSFGWLIVGIILLGISVTGLTIFSRFGKRVLDKLQSQHDIFTEFMQHSKHDSEEIRQLVFKNAGQLEKHALRLNSHEQKLNHLHKCYVEEKS